MHSRILRITPSITKRCFHSTRCNRVELFTALEPIYSGLQYSHAAGLEWHTILPLTAIAFRSAITLPISITNRLRQRKQAQLRPIISASLPIIKARLASSPAVRNGTLTMDQVEVLAQKESRKRRVALFKKHKCQIWKSVILLPAVQIPLWIAVSLVIRSMCGWAPVDGIPIEESFKTDSFLFYNDLIVKDPYGVLPLSIGAISLTNMEWNAKNINSAGGGRSENNGLTIPNLLMTASRFGAIFFMTIAFQAPTALCLYWVASNGFSLAQNVLLDLLLPLNYSPPKDTISDLAMEIQNEQTEHNTK